MAQKAIAAGIPGEQIDGNDLLAVRAVLEQALDKARRGGGPHVIEMLTYRLGDHTTADDARRYRAATELDRRQLEDPLVRLKKFLLRERLWSEADENAALEDSAAKVETRGQRVSRRGHTRSSLDVRAPVRGAAAQRCASKAILWQETCAMSEMTLVEAVNLALAHELETDPRVVLLGEDIGVNGGVFRATEGLLERFGAERVVDTPLAETLIAGMSIGMAAQGLRPVAEIQFMGFIYPAIDQLLNHAARLRTRTCGRLTCPLVLRSPTGGGIHAPEHHSESTEAMFAQIPGLRVVIPSSPARAYGLLLAAIRNPDPVVFLEPTRLYRLAKEAVPDTGEALPLDVCFVLREGTDVTLVTWGATTRETLAAAAALADDGIEAEVIDVATLAPLDIGTILDIRRQDGPLRDRPRGGG